MLLGLQQEGVRAAVWKFASVRVLTRCRHRYAPYNPRKRNQDSILMKEHKSTGTLMLCVLDGHGEAGDLVSHFITDHLARKTFAHKSFKTDPGLAMRDEVLKLEQALLKGMYCAVWP